MPRSFPPIRLHPTIPSAAIRRSTYGLIAFAALVVRVYLASLWFRFGMTKLEAGWLTSNPVRGLLTLVAGEKTPMPLPSLAAVADALLAVRADILLSVTLPLVEIVLAAAFLTGCGLRPAAVVAIAVNGSLILGGLASLAFDGRIILLQALLLLAGRSAGELGVPGVVRLTGAMQRAVTSLVEGGTGPESRRRAA